MMATEAAEPEVIDEAAVDEEVPASGIKEVDIAPVDEEADTVADMVLSDTARFERWQARRPPISHLSAGIVEANGERLPLFDINSRIVVEHRAACLDGNPWLETLVGRVQSIDDDTGVVSFLDEDADEGKWVLRYASFKAPTYDIRLAPNRGNPFTIEKVRVTPLPAPGEPKRGRGRPPGAKNRPKDVVQAEREAYRKLREEKKARRKGKNK
jgi:hypothetical protein